MAQPPYEDLEQRVRDLEAETRRLRQVEHELYQDHERYRIHFTLTNDVIYSLDPEFRVLSVSPSAEKMLGYRPEELIGRPFQELNVLAPEYLERAASDVFKVLSGKKIDATVYQFIARDGRRIFGEVSGVPLVHDGKAVAVVSVARDITERKQFEDVLCSKEKELEVRKRHLEEVNTALKVLLDHREEEKKKAQDDLVSTVEKLICPYLEKMETAGLTDEGKVYLDILRTNLEEMISPYMRGNSRQYQHLTPTEIQIADLVKQGKTTKEIACIANVSLHAVSFHRANIRKKLGLLHAKTNLRSYLHCADHP